MNLEEIKQQAWVADHLVEGPVKGVILEFHGLGNLVLRDEPTEDEIAWGAAGGLVVHPYYGPWSWMNRQARAFIDELVESIYAEYSLPDETPLISTGGSMGGHGSLLYTRYARRAVAACLARYPATDLTHHLMERPGLPRTIRFAMRGYSEDFAALLTEHSPLSQVAHMPDIPYMVIHGEADAVVSKTQHSDPFVAAMRKAGRDITYLEVPGMGHGGPPQDVQRAMVDFVSSFL